MPLHNFGSNPKAKERERKRIRELCRHDILNSAAETHYDRLTSVTAETLGMPVCIVSFVDSERIWFKSHHGIDIEEVGRDPGLCDSVIKGNGIYVVEDAISDPRTKINPLVTGDFKLRFYAGVPLITRSGDSLGAFTVIDFVPRTLTDQQMRFLETMAAIVIDELELRLLRLEEKELSIKLSKFAAHVPGMIYQYRLFPNGTSYFPYASKSFEQIHGITTKILKDNAKAAFDAIHPEDTDRVVALIRESARRLTAFKCEYRAKYKDGSVKWLYGTSMPEKLKDDSILWHGAIIDITEQKEKEAKLTNAHLFIKTATDNMSILVSYWTQELTCTFANAIHLEWYGLSASRMIGIKLQDLLSPAQFNERSPYIQAALRGKKQTFESTFTNAGGTKCRIQIQYVPDIENNRVKGLFAFISDVSAIKKAEENLRASESLFSTTFKDAAIGMVLFQAGKTNGEILRVNDAFCEMFGYSDKEITGKYIYELSHPEDAEKDISEFKRLLNDEVPDLSIEKRYMNKKGNIVWGAFHVSLVRDQDFNPLYFIGQILNITQRKSLEENLRQAQKMEVVGRLAGGVAHDFNNILTAMIFNLEELSSKDISTDVNLPLTHLNILAKQGAKLTQQLLAFARQQTMQKKNVEINDDLSSLVHMLGRLLGDNVHLSLERCAEPIWINADNSMLDQVFMNLCLNARDAMPDGGKLTLSTEIVNLDEEHGQYNPEARSGRFVKVSVRDTGIGMTPDVLTHIFEPFYTTKEIGKGTGLGLASTYGIIQQHDGWIEVNSSPGQGSTFHVFLPVFDYNKPARMTTALPVIVGQGHETILFVEDHAFVRDGTKRLLEMSGYKVLTAKDGVEAFDIWKDKHQFIDLLFTDMMMPNGMTGLQLTKKLREQKPSLLVLLTSGYSDPTTNISSEMGIAFLAKPYNTNSLLSAIKNCLNRSEV